MFKGVLRKSLLVWRNVRISRDSNSWSYPHVPVVFCYIVMFSVVDLECSFLVSRYTLPENSFWQCFTYTKRVPLKLLLTWLNYSTFVLAIFYSDGLLRTGSVRPSRGKHRVNTDSHKRIRVVKSWGHRRTSPPTYRTCHISTWPTLAKTGLSRHPNWCINFVAPRSRPQSFI